MTSILEGLPRELVWSILEYIPESVISLRTASRILQCRVDEYSLQPTAFFLIEQFIIRVDDMDLTIPERYSKLFALRLVLNAPSLSLLNGITHKSYRQFSGNLTQFTFMRNNKKTMEHLSSSIGLLIGIVAIEDEKNIIERLDFVSNLQEGIKFKQLNVVLSHISDDPVKYILKIISVHKVDILSIRMGKSVVSNPVKLLLDISSHVRTLCIVQITQLDRKANFFFGNIDWAPVILEMFSSRLNKLNITSSSYPDYLPDHSANVLVENLPLLDKKIWFTATCNAYPDGLNYIRGDYSVEADSSVRGRCSSYLKIKHVSRKNEFLWE